MKHPWIGMLLFDRECLGKIVEVRKNSVKTEYGEWYTMPQEVYVKDGCVFTVPVTVVCDY